MSVRVLVSGSREWADAERLVKLYGITSAAAEQMVVRQREIVTEALRSVFAAAKEFHPGEEVTLVHGNALGADQLCADVWKRAAAADPSRGLRVEAWPARWRQEGNSAGYHRNARMVASGADVMVVFHVERSKGTEHAMSLAVAAGVPVYLYAWRDGVEKPVVKIDRSNIEQFFPPLGRGHRTMWQQLTLEEESEDARLLVMAALVEALPNVTVHSGGLAADDVPPMCGICGGEAGHLVGCAASGDNPEPEPTRWHHDASIGEDRCGVCGGTYANAPHLHSETHCYVACTR